MPVTYIQALKVTATNDCNYINTVVSFADPNAPFPLTGNLVFKNMAGITLNAAPITAVLTSSGDSISIVTATEDIGNPSGVVKVTYEINNNITELDTTDDPQIADYTTAYKLMERLINDACTGTVKYGENVKSIKEFNDTAIEQETGIIIGKLTQKDWEDSILVTTPGNHIIDTDIDSFAVSKDVWGI